MEKEHLFTLIENPESLDASTFKELKTVVEKYPYFHTARLLYTKNADVTDHESYGDELGKTAVLCADRRKLFYLIHKDSYRELLHQPEETRSKEKDRTEALLDSFLTSLEENEGYATTIADAELNIVSTDYLSYLESLGEDTETNHPGKQKLQHQEIIDAFIEKAASDTIFTPSETPTAGTGQKTDNEENESEFLTETLARIYIKQKKYEQALTIIKRLSLNFPKKSVYFADQIRFLEYLIINEKNKSK